METPCSTSRIVVTSSTMHVEGRRNYDVGRRSVYLPIVRNHLYDAFDLFDYSEAGVTNGDRATTTVALKRCSC